VSIQKIESAIAEIPAEDARSRARATIA